MHSVRSSFVTRRPSIPAKYVIESSLGFNDAVTSQPKNNRRAIGQGTMSTILEISSLSKTFGRDRNGSRKALDNVSANVGRLLAR
jgi:hypothetical protein